MSNIDLTDLAIIMGKNGKDLKRLIEVLSSLVDSMPKAEKPNVNVNMDVERIIKAMPQAQK